MRNLNKNDLTEAIKNKKERTTKCEKFVSKKKFKRLPVKVFTKEEIEEFVKNQK